MKTQFGLSLQSKIRQALNFFGFDILRTSKISRLNLLGIKSLNITHIIDCGANEGQFAKDIIKCFPEAKLFCFEPLPGPFSKLSAWSKSNLEKIHIFPAAVGDSNGSIQIFLHQDHTASSSLLETTKHCETIYPKTKKKIPLTVPILTLDSAMKNYLTDTQSGILLKLDVQGFEDRVLRGAEKVLEKTSVCILEISQQNLYREQADFYELLHILRQKGLVYSGNLDQVYDETGRVVYLDAVFFRNGSL